MVTFVHSDLIFRCIQIYGGVSIRSLGTFLLDFDSATLVPGRLLLSPPVQKLTFKKEYDLDLDICVLLSQIGASSETIQNLHESIEQEIIGVKRDKHSLYLNNLGILNFNEESPTFHIDNEGLFNKYKYFPELSLVPIQRIQNEAGIPFIQNTKNNPKATSFSWYYIFWPIAIILLVSGVLFLRSCESISMTEKNKMNSVKIENHPLQENNHAFDSQEDQNVTDSNNLVESMVLIDTFKTEPVAAVEPIKEVVDTRDDSCIFVVGAFQVKNNAKNLQKRLKQMGYSVEVSNYDKFKRVGVVFSCNTLDTSTQFNKLKSDFPELWALH